MVVQTEQDKTAKFSVYSTYAYNLTPLTGLYGLPTDTLIVGNYGGKLAAVKKNLDAYGYVQTAIGQNLIWQ